MRNKLLAAILALSAPFARAEGPASAHPAPAPGPQAVSREFAADLKTFMGTPAGLALSARQPKFGALASIDSDRADTLVGLGLLRQHLHTPTYEADLRAALESNDAGKLTVLAGELEQARADAEPDAARYSLEQARQAARMLKNGAFDHLDVRAVSLLDMRLELYGDDAAGHLDKIFDMAHNHTALTADELLAGVPEPPVVTGAGAATHTPGLSPATARDPGAQGVEPPAVAGNGQDAAAQPTSDPREQMRRQMAQMQKKSPLPQLVGSAIGLAITYLFISHTWWALAIGSGVAGVVASLLIKKDRAPGVSPWPSLIGGALLGLPMMYLLHAGMAATMAAGITGGLVGELLAMSRARGTSSAGRRSGFGSFASGLIAGFAGLYAYNHFMYADGSTAVLAFGILGAAVALAATIYFFKRGGRWLYLAAGALAGLAALAAYFRLPH